MSENIGTNNNRIKTYINIHRKIIGLYGTYYASTNGHLPIKQTLVKMYVSEKKETENIRNFHMSEK